jgi:hypothetical protein
MSQENVEVIRRGIDLITKAESKRSLSSLMSSWIRIWSCEPWVTFPTSAQGAVAKSSKPCGGAHGNV